MGVTTTADEHYEAYKDHLEQAKKELLEVLNSCNWGSDEYNHSAIIRKLATLQELLEDR